MHAHTRARAKTQAFETSRPMQFVLGVVACLAYQGACCAPMLSSTPIRTRARARTHTHTHTHAHRRPAVVGDDAHQAPPVLRQARGPALGQATWHHLCFSRSCLYCTQNVVLTAHGVLSLLHICVHAITTPNKILIGIFTHANFYAHTSWCAHTHAHTSCTHPRASTETYTHTHTHRVDDKSDKLPEAEHGLSVSR